MSQDIFVTELCQCSAKALLLAVTLLQKCDIQTEPLFCIRCTKIDQAILCKSLAWSLIRLSRLKICMISHLWTRHMLVKWFPPLFMLGRVHCDLCNRVIYKNMFIVFVIISCCSTLVYVIRYAKLHEYQLGQSNYI